MAFLRSSLIFFGPLIAGAFLLQQVLLAGIDDRTIQTQAALDQAVFLRTSLVERIVPDSAAIEEDMISINLWPADSAAAAEASLRDWVFAEIERQAIEIERYSSISQSASDDRTRVALSLEFSASLGATAQFLKGVFSLSQNVSADRLSIRPSRNREQVEGRTQIDVTMRLVSYATVQE